MDKKHCNITVTVRVAREIIFAFCFLLLVPFLLSACSHHKALIRSDLSTERYESYQNNAVNGSRISEIDSGYYMVHMVDDVGCFLWYLEKEGSNQWIPVCSRPDCLHDSSGCNAYIDESFVIGLYRNKVYYIQESDMNTYICQMGMDGNEHKVLFELFSKEEAESSLGVSYQGYFHKDAFYAAVEVDVGGSRSRELRKVSLIDGRVQRIASLPNNIGNSFQLYSVGDDRILIYNSGREVRPTWYLYNVATDEFVELEFECPGVTSFYSDDAFCCVTVRGGGLYQVGKLSEKPRLLVDWSQNDPAEMIWTDGKYLYSGILSYLDHDVKQPGGFLSIYDMGGTLIQTVQLPEKMIYLSGTIGDRLFFCVQDQETDGLFEGPSYYLRKDQIGKENCGLVSIDFPK